MPLQGSHLWLLRAEEARAAAEDMQDQFAKQTMMKIVAICEMMAGYARSLEDEDGNNALKSGQAAGDAPPPGQADGRGCAGGR